MDKEKTSGVYYGKTIEAILEIQNMIMEMHIDPDKGDFVSPHEGFLAISEQLTELKGCAGSDFAKQVKIAKRISALAMKFAIEFNPNDLKSLKHEQN